MLYNKKNIHDYRQVLWHTGNVLTSGFCILAFKSRCGQNLFFFFYFSFWTVLKLTIFCLRWSFWGTFTKHILENYVFIMALTESST